MSYEFAGDVAWTFDDLAAAASAVLGREVTYQRLTSEHSNKTDPPSFREQFTAPEPPAPHVVHGRVENLARTESHGEKDRSDLTIDVGSGGEDFGGRFDHHLALVAGGVELEGRSRDVGEAPTKTPTCRADRGKLNE